MKKCSYCGFENPEEAVQCRSCHTDLVSQSQAPLAKPKSEPEMSHEERRFWDQMTFRQFAILLIRLQAVWLLFNAILDLTYLPSYFTRLHDVPAYSASYQELRRNLFFALLRVILHVAAAVAVIQCAERVLSWLVRDWIQTKPKGADGKPDSTEKQVSD